LVQRLQTVVAQASPGNRSCAITNRSPIDDAHPGRFPRVTVQVRLRCGAGEMAAVLHELESGTPRLFVDNLNILAQRYFFAPGQGANQSGGLDVSFDLYGYLRPPPARPQAAKNPGANDSAP
jgi:general secretion pathway protein M